MKQDYFEYKERVWRKKHETSFRIKETRITCLKKLEFQNMQMIILNWTKTRLKKKHFKLIIYTYKKKGKKKKDKKRFKNFFPIIGYTLFNFYLKKLKFTRKYLISVMIANKNFYMVSNVYEWTTWMSDEL